MARGDRERIDDILTATRSVLYSVGVIGEAAKNLSPEFKAALPGIPWRAVAGIRDRVVHEYFRTNTQRIWDVVTDDLDPLEKALRTARGRGQT